MKKKDKNGKIPFNVFSKKGLTTLALAGVMAFTPFMAGCSGTPGEKGDTGAAGKSAYELAVENGFEGTLQEWLESLKGANGQDGQDGQNGQNGQNGNGIESITKTGTEGLVDTYTITFTDGTTQTFTINNGKGVASVEKISTEGLVDTYKITFTDGTETTYTITNGEDGTSVYVGYDGYVWNGKVRTELSFTTLENDVAENTLELMNNKYFELTEITAGTKVVMMANYFENIHSTQYSGTSVTEISTYVSADGKLDLGVINLDTGDYTLKETVDVEEGLNTITTDISVGENETLVLGGDTTTVNLYKSSGVDAKDKFGEFTTDLTDFSINQTSSVNDKLVINVKVKTLVKKMICMTPELESVYAERTSGYTAVINNAAPFIYQNPTKFSGKTIKKMKAFINTVSYVEDVATMDIALITVPNTFAVGTQIPTYDETYTIKLPKSFFSEQTTINAWKEIDFTQYAYKSDGTLATEGIEVGENQTLVFAANKNEKVLWGFNGEKWTANDGEQFFQTTSNAFKDNTAKTTLNFLFYYEDYIEEGTIADNIERLESLDKEAYFKTVLSGKNLSILGDSISTFTGVSNDAEEGQANNAVWYTNQMTQADTYWQQIITEYNMDLCVNNSWSGAFLTQHTPNVNAQYDSDGTISSGMARADELDSVDGSTPDYIIVYIGINDLNAGVSSDLIATAYDTMLDTITATYPNAKVFCLNMPNRNTGSSPVAYNTAIANAINAHDNVYLVDLYNSEFEGDVYQANSADNLHPNANGMDYMTDIIVDTMREVVVSGYKK